MKTKKVLIASILFGAFAIVFLGCSKDQNLSSTFSGAKNELQKAIMRMSIPDLNPEAARIYEDIMNADVLFSIVHYSNHGESQSLEINGITDKSSKMSLNLGIPKLPNLGKTWWQGIDEDEVLFGAYNSVVVENSSVGLDTLTFYVPNKITLSNLSDDINLAVSNGVNLQWNADSNNPTGLVLIYLSMYDEILGAEPFDRVHILTEDDGQYDITSELQNTSIAMIKVVIVRGNGRFVSDPNADLFVNIRSQDEHIYFLTH